MEVSGDSGRSWRGGGDRGVCTPRLRLALRAKHGSSRGSPTNGGRMRSIASLGLVLIGSAGLALAEDPAPSVKPVRIVKRAFRPVSVVWAAAGASISQANGTPREWGQDWPGFGQRFASAFGKHL